MENVIKVLHVFGSLGMGGAESMMMNLLRNIDRTLIRFDFIEHTEEECFFEKEILSYGSVIYRCPRFNGKNYFEYRYWWKDFLKNHPEYQILHSHVRSTASIYIPIAKKRGLKTIIHSHSTSNGAGFSSVVKKAMQYPLRYQADYFFACSKEAGEWLFGKKVCSRENFYVIKNAIHVEKFEFNPQIRSDARKEFGLEDSFVVGFIARVIKAKNPLFVVDVFEEVHKKKKNAKLLFVGDGELLPIVKEKVKEKNMQSNVVFTGTRSDVERLLQVMDCYLMPSLWEGLGISLIEAQASGIRCICSENIPREAIITDLVSVIPLNEGHRLWAEKAQEADSDYKRCSYLEMIRKAGYDIVASAEKISTFYRRLADG